MAAPQFVDPYTWWSIFGLFQFGAMTDKAVVNFHVHILSFLLGKILRLGHGAGICLIFIRNCQVIFPSGYTTFYSYLRCMEIPISLPPCQHLVLSLFLVLAIPATVCVYFVCVCVCVYFN